MRSKKLLTGFFQGQGLVGQGALDLIQGGGAVEQFLDAGSLHSSSSLAKASAVVVQLGQLLAAAPGPAPAQIDEVGQVLFHQSLRGSGFPSGADRVRFPGRFPAFSAGPARPRDADANGSARAAVNGIDARPVRETVRARPGPFPRLQAHGQAFQLVDDLGPFVFPVILRLHQALPLLQQQHAVDRPGLPPAVRAGPGRRWTSLSQSRRRTS